MEFLELAQYFTLEQIKQNEEGITDTTPDPALVEMFNNMIDEMFDYGRFILNKKKDKPENDLLSAIANAKKPILMAKAFKDAVVSGRNSYLAGRMNKNYFALARSPSKGLI